MNTTVTHGAFSAAGRKFRCGNIPVVELRGTWRQMGRQYGNLMREELAKVYQFAMKNPEGIERVGQLGRNGKISGIHRYDELYNGIAETSGFTPEQLAIINSVEVVYLDRLVKNVRDMFDANRCSSLALWGDYTSNGKLLFGRNYDWLPEFSEILDTLTISVLHPADGSLPVASLNWAGCLYMTTGMNGNGIFLELNSGMYADSRIFPERLHNIWLLWEILLNADSLNSVQTALSTFRASASYLIGTGTANCAECFEWHTGENSPNSAPRKDGMFAAANHFTTPGWINSPDAEMNGCASSCQRRNALESLAEQYHSSGRKIELEDLCSILETSAADGGACVKGTLFQVIAEPAKMCWYVKTKNQQEWSRIFFGNLLKLCGDLA